MVEVVSLSNSPYYTLFVTMDLRVTYSKSLTA